MMGNQSQPDVDISADRARRNYYGAESRKYTNPGRIEASHGSISWVLVVIVVYKIDLVYLLRYDRNTRVALLLMKVYRLACRESSHSGPRNE